MNFFIHIGLNRMLQFLERNYSSKFFMTANKFSVLLEFTQFWSVPLLLVSYFSIFHQQPSIVFLDEFSENGV